MIADRGYPTSRVDRVQHRRGGPVEVVIEALDPVPVGNVREYRQRMQEFPGVIEFGDRRGEQVETLPVSGHELDEHIVEPARAAELRDVLLADPPGAAGRCKVSRGSAKHLFTTEAHPADPLVADVCVPRFSVQQRSHDRQALEHPLVPIIDAHKSRFSVFFNND